MAGVHIHYITYNFVIVGFSIDREREILHIVLNLMVGPFLIHQSGMALNEALFATWNDMQFIGTLSFHNKHC